MKVLLLRIWQQWSLIQIHFNIILKYYEHKKTRGY